MKKFVFCLAVLICGNLFAQKTYQLPDYPKELEKNANRILIEEIIETDVTRINKMTTKKREVWLILNKKGHQSMNLSEYYDENSKVKKISAQFYDTNGKRHKNLKRKKDFQDLSHTGVNLYSDSRVISAAFHPAFYPYVVVFESEKESGDTGFIYPWYPIRSYAKSTHKSVYKIKFDPKNKLRYKPMNFDGYNVAVEEKPEELVFTAENIKALKPEELSPTYRDIFPYAFLALDNFTLKGKQGPASSWKEFGKWMEEELLKDTQEIPEHTIQRIKNLVANEETNEGKARKIYQFLQDKVRYVSVQIGIGGWKPMPAAEVDKLSYGDCKALTNYTKVLLDALGIPSYYTILYADRNVIDIQEDFVSLQGNHAILGIPDGDKITWLECTNQEMPYGYIGSFSHNRDVLMITPEGGEIVKTKTYTAEENLQKTKARIQLDASGNITAFVNRQSEGLMYEYKYHLPKLKSEDVDAFYKKAWRNINGFSISEVTFDNNRKDIVFNENLKIETASYLKPVSDGFLINPNVFNRRSYVPPQIPNRKYPFEISFGYVYEDIVEIEVPEGLQISWMPESVALKTLFGSFNIEVSQVSPDVVVYKRILKINEGVFPASEYENYRDFRRTVNRLDTDKFIGLKKLDQ